MKQYKLVVIGFDNSFYAVPIAECCKNNSRMQLVGASDPSPEKLKEYEEKFAVPVVDTDWRTLLDRCPCDIVVVFNATSQHEEVVIEAARRGKDIICIKPLALSYESALHMQKAVEESGVQFMMMHNYRFTPALLKVKSLLESDAIGRIASLTMNSRAKLPEDWPGSGKPGWYAEPELSGGGGFIDHGSHTVDFVMWLFGDQMPKAVNGVAGNHIYKDLHCDDGGVAILEFDKSVATVESTWYAPPQMGSSEFLQIVGEKGEIFSNRAGRPYLELRRNDNPIRLERFEFDQPVWTDMLTRVIESFLDSLEKGAPNRAPISQGVNAMRVLDAFKASVSSGKKVEL